MYKINEIEDAIVSRLKTQIPYLLTCNSLGDIIMSQAQERTLNYPAVYVVYKKGTYDHQIAGVQDKEMDFTVVAMAKNYRGEKEARHGKLTEKGAYNIMDDVRAALTNHAVGLDIDPLFPMDESELDGGESVATYGVVFRTKCRFTYTL